MQAAVLGSPIAHSLSPALHLAAYRALGLDWQYSAIEVRTGELAAFVASCDSTWAGLSLTMPLKVEVLDLLDESDDVVALTGSANTLVFRGERRIGFNTDVFGIIAALRESSEIASRGGATTAVVIGSGATARSAVMAVSELGVHRVSVVARRPAAASAIAQFAVSLGMRAEVVSWESATGFLADVVVSTIPSGAADSIGTNLRLAGGVLLDVAYTPWPTPLVTAWRSFGGQVVGGLSMLMWQAAEQVRIMTGRPAPVDAMRRALAAAGR